jgi:hypothetical protein
MDGLVAEYHPRAQSLDHQVVRELRHGFRRALEGGAQLRQVVGIQLETSLRQPGLQSRARGWSR